MVYPCLFSCVFLVLFLALLLSFLCFSALFPSQTGLHRFTCALSNIGSQALSLLCTFLHMLSPPCTFTLVYLFSYSLVITHSQIHSHSHMLFCSCPFMLPFSYAYVISHSFFPFCTLTHFHLLTLTPGHFLMSSSFSPPRLLPSCLFPTHLISFSVSLSVRPIPAPTPLSCSLTHLKLILPYF